ncbi:MAG: RNA polymerase sigma-70 factor [Bacteroidales bacterium]|nr:RNA polymerase sigma-70 factor [Bacteroidales bacterium]
MEDLEKINDLIARIAKDDTRAFEILFHLYHKRIYAFAQNLLNSADDAEEIVQNVFLALWNQRKNLNISGSFTSYIFAIARNMVYEHIRQKINKQAFSEYYLEHNVEYSFITEEEVAYNELEGKIKQYIDLLPERRREIFILSRIEKMSYKEIAQKLNITENTVDTQIRNALNTLRRQLTEYLISISILFMI